MECRGEVSWWSVVMGGRVSWWSVVVECRGGVSWCGIVVVHIYLVRAGLMLPSVRTAAIASNNCMSKV